MRHESRHSARIRVAARERDTPARLIALIRVGLLSLDGFEVTAFPLDRANAAVAHAAAHGRPFRTTVIAP